MKAFSLLVHLGLLQACLGKKCYYPNGQEARNAYPCDPDAEHSTCCSGSAWGKSCLANKLCVTPGMRFARGSCTDPTFKSPACPDICTNHRTGVWDVVNCLNTTGVDTIYCCYGMENCCEQGNGRFQLLPPPSHTWAVYNSELTQYDVVTPLSTATSSASMSTTSTSSDASDTSDASSTTSGTSASTSGSEQPEETGGSSQAGTDSSTNSNEPTGLSTAAQAGIGVGAAVGAILIIGMAYLAWQLSKTKKALAADSQWQAVTTYPPAAPSSAYYSQDPAHKHEVQGDLANGELQGQHHFVDGGASRVELSATPSFNSPESPILHHPSLVFKMALLIAAMKMVNSGPKYRDEILKMMFVAGETRQPDVETTTMVENIVRDQTIHMLTVAGELAARRGQTKFTIDDIIFQVRNDAECLARLRNHMQWKQIRKRARVKDDGTADDLDVDDVDDIIEDEGGDGDAEATGATEPDPDPATPQSKSDGTAVMASGPEVSIPPLPWSILSMFPHAADIPSLAAIDNDDEIGGEDPGPSSGKTTSRWLLARLMKNDERTRTMTAEEYNAWSDCRSASFTYRKKKTFREWCGLGVIIDHRAKDDVLEILGFLTSEWVQKLTERALQVQRQEARESAGV
ncbi:transcription initiation factor IID, 18kD subunit-domain-containing protein [Chaetomium tenue]|uniref:Transcription initiation factor IID, 18kD subunit-domain-containing protein n=1 Tax=Chaetomium tenue TaxID=1854479 RepID=A0ACB7PJZ2_9PEZI|nr:transcription initiation factor IID, 18kD subunit-domain-containing protein [Chaetomium globosum]